MRGEGLFLETWFCASYICIEIRFVSVKNELLKNDIVVFWLNVFYKIENGLLSVYVEKISL